MRPILLNLVWIHQNLAEGPTQQRWKSQDVFAFERTGGKRLLVGLNRNKNQAQHLAGLMSGFGPHQVLHDYTGHGPDLTTDSLGRVDLPIPANHAGLGYVCYSVPGIEGQTVTTPQDTTQVFEGAADLDIGPAAPGPAALIGRIYCSPGTQINGVLNFDTSGWTANSSVTLTLQDPAGTTIGNRSFRSADTGAALAAASTTKGFYSWKINAADPRAEFRAPFTLTATYRAPQIP